MRPVDKVSWVRIFSLGTLLTSIWLGWAIMPPSFADGFAARFVQLNAASMPLYKEKEQKSKELDYHAWTAGQLAAYEQSEQRHFFLLEKSGFYLSLQKFVENAQAGWIIYRPLSRGSSVVWIRTLEPVQKGSPVIIGDCAIGFIDAVNGLCARVRLITDSRSRVAVEARKLKPSKENLQPASASSQRLALDVAYWKLLASHGLFQGLSQRAEIQKLLDELEKTLKPQSKENLEADSQGLYGLLRGAATSWRSQKNLLMAEGFYQDVSSTNKQAAATLHSLEAGDLLVTSGLDGRYPSGLRVGYVTEVRAQDPANTLFEVEASVALADFSKEKWLWVLPALTPLDESALHTREI